MLRKDLGKFLIRLLSTIAFLHSTRYVYAASPSYTDDYLNAPEPVDSPTKFVYYRIRPDRTVPLLQEPSDSSKERYVSESEDIVRVTTRSGDGYRLIESTGTDGYLRPAFVSEDDLALNAEKIGDRLKGVRGFIDLPQNETTQLYNVPGKTTADCKAQAPAKNAPCLGKIRGDAEVTVLDVRLNEVVDPLTLERRLQSFYKVKFHQLGNSRRGLAAIGEGWIPADFISSEPTQSQPVARPKAPLAVICPLPVQQDPPIATQPLPQPNPVSDLHRAVNDAALDGVVTQLHPYVGACIEGTPGTLPKFNGPQTPFNQVMMPYYSRNEVPRIQLPNGTTLTRLQLNSIDAVARTIYAEMAICWGYGSHYFQGVSAVIHNREVMVRDGTPNQKAAFVREPDSRKSIVMEVVSDPVQFSAWNAPGENGNNSLNQALCPPSRAGRDFWKGGHHPPEQDEQDIWDSVLRIATEEVLQPERLEERARELPWYFYTSGRGRFLPGFKQVSGSIDGTRLSRNRCIELWNKPGYP